ncbi:MAG TPA: hypothetical protein PKN44_15690 [Bacteroidales bacterium]|nr:hypothetical protein [Bacteroidales bacterium]
MMYLPSSFATRLSPTAPTRQRNAWKNGYYATCRIHQTIPAARLYGGDTHCRGHWFAVDTYDLSIEDYHRQLALVDREGRPVKMKSPALAIFLLRAGAVFNVGIAREQGYYGGGAWQFEYVKGDEPVLIERTRDPSKIRL